MALGESEVEMKEAQQAREEDGQGIEGEGKGKW